MKLNFATYLEKTDDCYFIAPCWGGSHTIDIFQLVYIYCPIPVFIPLVVTSNNSYNTSREVDRFYCVDETACLIIFFSTSVILLDGDFSIAIFRR